MLRFQHYLRDMLFIYLLLASPLDWHHVVQGIVHMLRAVFRMQESVVVKILHIEMAAGLPLFCPLGTREDDQSSSFQGTKAPPTFPSDLRE